MTSNAKGKSSLWYGYLNAGERSSPVLRDSRLETGNPKTVYLFNLLRGEIIEYALEIVEKKLRELKPGEAARVAELDAGYKKVRRGFRARGERKGVTVLETSGPPSRKPVDQNDNDSDDDGLDDSDLWLESGEA